MTMTDIKLPCMSCVTFPTCRIRYMHKLKVDKIDGADLRTEFKKFCSILEEYYKQLKKLWAYNHINYYRYKFLVYEFHSYFRHYKTGKKLVMQVEHDMELRW